MRLKHGLCALILVLASGPLFAQGSADDQAAVWAAVENLWSAEERGDTGWVDSMLSADFMGWPSHSPAPRSKASTRMWARFNADQGKGLSHARSTKSPMNTIQRFSKFGVSRSLSRTVISFSTCP